MPNEWLIQHLRLSFFSSDDRPTANPEPLFLDLTGVEPEVEEWRGGRIFHRRVAVVGDRRVELVEQPYRVDFVQIGQQNLDVAAVSGSIEDASLGTQESLPGLMASAGIISSRVSNPIRVALGGLFFVPTQSVTESYQILGQAFPNLDLVPERTSDFTIQMNRFRQSKAFPGLRVNRLSTWQAVTMSLLSEAGATVRQDGSHWVQAVLDVNTDAANRAVFGQDAVPGILEEMARSVHELLRAPTA